MKILVIVGSDLSINSSANLCHCAYINGFVENGDTVDIISKKEVDNNLHNQLHGIRNIFEIESTSLYEKLRNRRKMNYNAKSEDNINENENRISITSKIIIYVKNFVHYMYGPYEVLINWYKKAKNIHLNEEYDYVISFSFPPVSHYLAYRLIKDKKNKM